LTIADAATGDRVAEAGDRNGGDTAALRAVLGSFASGVTVVTTAVDGWLHGMTANAFSSLSLDPPLVLVCVRKTARMHGLIERGGAFAVNILSEGQEETARYFATRGRPAEAEFAAIPHVAGVLGLPLLLGTAGAWSAICTRRTMAATTPSTWAWWCRLRRIPTAGRCCTIRASMCPGRPTTRGAMARTSKSGERRRATGLVRLLGVP